MEINMNFNEDLKVQYLAMLAKSENKQEFERFYPSIENYLVLLAEKSKDSSLLCKINDIFAYRKKCIGKQL